MSTIVSANFTQALELRKKIEANMYKKAGKRNIEREDKWLILINIPLLKFLNEIEPIKIVQTYLQIPKDSREHRLRAKTINHKTSFYYCIKDELKRIFTDSPKEYLELETEITKEDYEILLILRNPDLKDIIKHRRKYQYDQSHVLEFDEYYTQKAWKCFLILELEYDEPYLPPLPSILKNTIMVKVTSDRPLNNASLAKSFPEPYSILESHPQFKAIEYI